MTNADPFVIHQADVPVETFAWGSLQWLCHHRLSPGAVQTVGLSQILPGQQNPLHYHPNCEEVLYVLTGRGRHSFDGQCVDLHPGSLIRIPTGVRHNLVNTSEDVLTCLVAFSSGARETVFVEERRSR